LPFPPEFSNYSPPGANRRAAGAVQSSLDTSTMTASIRHTRAALCLAGLLLAVGLALAGCETTGSGPGAVAADKPAVPMTHVQAAEDCWMATEKSDAHMDLDKRADVVDKCIAEKMGVKPAETKAATKPETKPKTAGTKPATKPKPKAKVETKPKPKAGDAPEAKPESK
jgi:outer membrane biosynthesis protein TonB